MQEIENNENVFMQIISLRASICIQDSSMTDITLNCRIVSNDLLCDRRITIDRGQTVSALETAIRNNLGASFNNIPLDIRQIHPSSVNERRMQSQTLISEYFNGQPDTDYVHITVHPVLPKEKESE
ncbi:uncharacterized protein OCT59_023387 [Rhizophagus irregularis]|nr:hypothetical protein OCT59_023387 [Rhizophagus irregularis]